MELKARTETIADVEVRLARAEKLKYWMYEWQLKT